MIRDDFHKLRRELILEQIGAERYLRRLARGVRSPEDRARVPRLGVSLRGRVQLPASNVTADSNILERREDCSSFAPLPIDPFIIASRDVYLDQQSYAKRFLPSPSDILAASKATVCGQSPNVSPPDRQPPMPPPTNLNEPFTSNTLLASGPPNDIKKNDKNSQSRTQLARMKRHRRRSTHRRVEFTGSGKAEDKTSKEKSSASLDRDKLNEEVKLRTTDDTEKEDNTSVTEPDDYDKEFWAMMERAEKALSHSKSSAKLDKECFDISGYNDIGNGSKIKQLLLSHAVEHHVPVATRQEQTRDDSKNIKSMPHWQRRLQLGNPSRLETGKHTKF